LRPWLVVWRDAYSPDATWMTADDIGDPVIVSTIGYIVDGPKGYVTVADSTYRSGGVRYLGGVTVIPKAMVIERRRLVAQSPGSKR
jgi:hypothetical protein